MKTAILALCVVVAFAMVPTATLAGHDGDCQLTSSEPDIEAGGIAVFIDYADPAEGYSIWVYQESNDIEGFQRDDAVVSDELCGHAGDTIIF